MVAGQYIYNLIHRELEREIIPAAIDAGIGLTCFSPLGGGLLTGKYGGSETPGEGTRASYRTNVYGPRFWHRRGFETVRILKGVSEEFDISMVDLAIGWPLGRRFVTSVIIGARNLEQLEANLVPADWDIPEDAWNALEERTRPDEEYMSWYNKFNYKRFFEAAEFHDPDVELL